MDQQIVAELLRLAEMIMPGCTKGAVEQFPLLSQVREDTFREMLRGLRKGLTARELDVCCRALIGQTSEGIALSLNIKTSSVTTYKKRAYQRLGISSYQELIRLVMP